MLERRRIPDELERRICDRFHPVQGEDMPTTTRHLQFQPTKVSRGGPYLQAHGSHFPELTHPDAEGAVSPIRKLPSEESGSWRRMAPDSGFMC